MKKIIICVSTLLILGSCTENRRTKLFGGNETINLPVNCKFINGTWKGDNLWLIYEDTTTHICYMREKSNWGILEGTIEIKKSKQMKNKGDSKKFVIYVIKEDSYLSKMRQDIKKVQTSSFEPFANFIPEHLCQN